MDHEKKEEDQYATEDDYSICLLPTPPVPGFQNFHVFNLCLRIGDNILISVMASLYPQAFEAAIHDIMMNPMVFGTPNNNTGDKTVYVMSVFDNTSQKLEKELEKDFPKLVHGDSYLVLDTSKSCVLAYDKYDSCFKKIGEKSLVSYPRLHFQVDGEEVKLVTQKELKLYDASTNTGDQYTKVLLVPESETGKQDFTKSYVDYIRFSHEQYKIKWYKTESKQSFLLLEGGLLINEDGHSFRTYMLST